MSNWIAQTKQRLIDAAYPGVSKGFTTPDQYQAMLDQLQQQMAALPVNGGLYTTLRRSQLQHQINSTLAQFNQAKLQFDPNNGITSPATPAPVLGPRLQEPKVGIDALKILLPTG